MRVPSEIDVEGGDEEGMRVQAEEGEEFGIAGYGLVEGVGGGWGAEPEVFEGHFGGEVGLAGEGGGEDGCEIGVLGGSVSAGPAG